MNRFHRPLFAGLMALAVLASCDTVEEPTAPTPLLHEKEDHQDCDADAVNCVAGLDHPAVYANSKNLHFMGFSSRSVPNGTSAFNSDLAFWGQTAYQGTYEGFRIIDISQPDNPVEVLNYTGCDGGTNGGAQGDLVIWNNLLIRTWDAPANSAGQCAGQAVGVGFQGLHVFDIGNHLAPQLVASIDLPCGSHTAMGVPDPANGRLLIYSSPSSTTIGCRGLDIVEIPLASPVDARYLRFEPTARDLGELGRPCHDGAVILGTVNLLACAGGNGFTMWSMSQSAGGSLEDPMFLYSQQVPGVTVGHSAAFTWDGEVLIFGHEPGGGGAARCQATGNPTDRSLFFFKARTGDPLGSFVMPRAQTARENCTWHYYNVVPVDGRYVLVAGNYQSGISVVDFTDPASAREIAFADPDPLVHPTLPNGIVVGGDWSAYWYNGFIYESDIRRGLAVWRLSDHTVAGASRLEHMNPQTQLTSAPLRGKP